MIIYKTINKINGKIYIGFDTKNDPNYLGSGKILKRAIEKYGKENFKKEVIEECESLKILSKREIYWIDKFNACESEIGYNISKGGNGGNLGELVNKKISENRKGKRAGKDHPNYGKPRSDEIKKKISESNKGRLKGIRRSDEIKLKISKSHKDKNALIENYMVGKNNPMFNKKQKESTKKIQRQKAKGRFTLGWFIERNGEIVGKEKYEEFRERCRKASKLGNKKRWG